MVPIQLTIIPLYIILGRLHWIDTHLSIIVPAALFNAFGVFLLRQYVRGIPLELEEAAAIDGASRVKIFVTIILPLLKTPMVALGIFIFLGQLNNFFYPLIFLNSDNLFTLPRWVNQFKGAYSYDWGGLMAATSLAAVPFLIIFIIAQKQIVEGIALSLVCVTRVVPSERDAGTPQPCIRRRSVRYCCTSPAPAPPNF